MVNNIKVSDDDAPTRSEPPSGSARADATGSVASVEPSTGTSRWSTAASHGHGERVDRDAGQLILTEGTIVRVTPSTIVQRGTERLTLDALQPGWEIVAGVPPAPANDASRIDVVWSPSAGVR